MQPEHPPWWKMNSESKRDVLAELKYEPIVNITDIGVSVKDGTVTPNGYATSYGENGGSALSPRVQEQTNEEAIQVWENEGNPN